MTTPMKCSQVIHQLPELAREELAAPIEVAIESHLAACTDCARAYDEVREGFRVLQAVRGLDLPRGAENRLPVMRAHIMAAIRAEQERPVRLSWLQVAFGAAAAAVVFAGLTLVTGPGRDPGPALSATADTPPVATHPTDSEAIATVAFAKTTDGVLLSWPGDGPTYKVLRSTRPGRFQDAAVTVVCGNSWTDREDTGSLVYYQVVPAHDRCRT